MSIPISLLTFTIAAVVAYAAGDIPFAFGNHREIARSQDVSGNGISSYLVSDDLTGDYKSHHEVRNNFYDVSGVHSQLDPNGYFRTVHYLSTPFGTQQAITGSENGLYVESPYYVISPKLPALSTRGF